MTNTMTDRELVFALLAVTKSDVPLTIMSLRLLERDLPANGFMQYYSEVSELSETLKGLVAFHSTTTEV